MHALVIGAGVAGTTTAVALAEAGITAEIHEAYGRDSDGVGAWLTLAGNGLDALGTLGLAERVAAAGFPTPRGEMLDHRGRVITELAMGAPRDDGLQVHTMRRTDLYRALRDAVDDRGVPVHYGRSFVGVERTATGGVRATFADGSTADGDVLIGADGLHSAVRRSIDPDSSPVRYQPLINTGGYARGADVDGEPGVLRFAFGRRCFMGWVAHPDGTHWWFANVAGPVEPPGRGEIAAAGPRFWYERLVDSLDGDRLPVRELLDATGDMLSGWGTFDVPSVPVWYRGAAVLIGDAAHATSPAAGQGASMAVEDALVLARELRDRASVRQAFAAFERQRRQRVERVVALGHLYGRGKLIGPVGRVLRDRVVIPLMASGSGRRLANPDPWLHRHHVDWVPAA